MCCHISFQLNTDSSVAQASLKVTLKVLKTLIGCPLKRAGSYFQVFTASTAALAKGSSPRTTFTRSTLPSARMTISSTTTPVRPSARASCGYGGITLLLFGRGGIASSGSSIGAPATPPTTPPSVVPPSRPAGSCLSPSPWTAIPLSSSGLASGGGSLGIRFGATIGFGGGGFFSRRTVWGGGVYRGGGVVRQGGVLCAPRWGGGGGGGVWGSAGRR